MCDGYGQYDGTLSQHYTTLQFATLFIRCYKSQCRVYLLDAIWNYGPSITPMSEAKSNYFPFSRCGKQYE